MSDVSYKQKLIVLALLVVQNASSALLMRYSRGILNESYNPSTAVLMSEFCKFFICIFLIIFGVGDSGLSNFANNRYSTIQSKVIYLIQNSGYTWVPATCYFIQNSLYYIASGNLSSSVFGTLQQLKILSAALCSVFILRKHLEYRQWRALLLLIFGGILMEYHTFELHESNELNNNNDPAKGTAAMLAIISLSGFAGVMTELLLKNKKIAGKSGNDENINVMSDKPKLSIWDRNIQLAFWSIIFGFIAYFFNTYFMNVNVDDDDADDVGFFNGWSPVTFILVLLWTGGGLLVALTIKYTDVIVKGFASAISLILICCGGNFLLGDTLDIVFLIGAGVTIISTFNYNDKNNGGKHHNVVIKGNMDKSTIQPLIMNDNKNTKQ